MAYWQAIYQLVACLTVTIYSQAVAHDSVDGILEQWARERPELETDAMGVFGRIFRLAAAAGNVMERTYQGLGLSRADFDVLATLRRSGEPFQLSPGALSGSLMLTTGGMTGRLDRLERAGLVARSAAPSDRRSLLVTLTEPGRTLIDEAVVAGLEAQRLLLADLPATSRRKLDDLLRELLIAVGDVGAAEAPITYTRLAHTAQSGSPVASGRRIAQAGAKAPEAAK